MPPSGEALAGAVGDESYLPGPLRPTLGTPDELRFKCTYSTYFATKYSFILSAFHGVL
jgi:hypothetical protein